MTTPTSPMAAVKLLREALEFCAINGNRTVYEAAKEALRLTASIEQPTSEDARLVELMKMSESVSEETLRKGLRLAIGWLCKIASDEQPTSEAVAYVKYEVGALPVFYPVIAGRVHGLTDVKDISSMHALTLAAPPALLPAVQGGAQLAENHGKSLNNQGQQVVLDSAPVDERARFELTANTPSLRRHAIYPDQYADQRAQELWSNWKARAALQQPGLADKVNGGGG